MTAVQEEQGLLSRNDDPFAANLDCIHCGLCLPKCPTYQVLGTETDSPRGRIHLMKAAQQGRIELDEKALHHLDGCLACRACESACPSGVRYELMLTRTRGRIRRERPPGLLRRAAFRHLLPRPSRIRKLAALLRLYQRSGLQRFVRSSGILDRMAPQLAQAESKLPAIPKSRPLDEAYPPRGERRARVGFLTGCVMPALFPEVHEASVEVLRRSGCEVVIPPGQTCCGALHSHDGQRQSARELAARNIRLFLRSDEQKGLDAVVVNSAGCAAAMKDYPHLFGEEGRQHSLARRLALKVRDIQEFLAGLQPEWNLRPVPARVAYDDACHLLHGQGVSRQPRQLLRAIPGLEVLDVPNADRCCGAAGLYTIDQPEMSMRLLDRKIEEILSVDPQRVASANPGCLLQLRYGMQQRGLSLPIQHPVELLREALG